MRKHGFTLVEVIATLAIMAVIVTVAIPSVIRILEQSKEDLFHRQESIIVNGAEKYVVQHTYDLLWQSNIAEITFHELAEEGYIKDPIKDPRTDIPYDMNESKVLAIRVGNRNKYQIIYAEDGNQYFVFNGTNPEILSCGTSSYQDRGVTYINDKTLVYGKEEDITNINNHLKQAGTYRINYEYLEKKIQRLVVITNNKAPKITLTENHIILSSTNTTFHPIDYIESVLDDCEGDITSYLSDSDMSNGRISSNVILGVPGIYAVNYTVVNRGGIVSTARLDVEIKNTELIVNGNNPDNVSCSATGNYQDQGATLKGTDITVYADPLSLKNVGTHTLLYSYNADTIPVVTRRVVNITNNNTPTITLTKTSVTIYKGDTFDPSIYLTSASDPCEGDITSKVTTTSNVVTDVPGTYTVTYQVSNKASIERNVVLSVVVKDISSPILVLPSVDGSNGWYKTSKNITVNYNKEMLNSYEYAISTDGTNYSNYSNTTSNTFSLNKESGTIYIKIRGKRGNKYTNIVTSRQIKMDTVAPTCTSSGGSSTWVTNRTITGTCSDTTSRCQSTTITKSYTTNTNTSTASPGNVTDKAGNSITCPANQIVKIDVSTPGSPFVYGESSTWSTYRTYTLTPPSSLSGIRYYEYYISNTSSRPSSYVSATGSRSSTSITVSAPGKYIFFRAVNNTNIKGEWSAYQYYYVDSSILNTPSVSGGSTAWNTSRTYNITPPSSLSGIKNYEFYVSDSSSTPNTNVSATGSSTSTNITVNRTGRYVFFRAINNANTKSSWTSYQNHYVDTSHVSAPTVSGASSTWSTSRTFRLTPPNSLSGIKHYEYYISNSSSSPSSSQSATGSSASSSITINSTGRYIYFRAVNNANVRSDWTSYQYLYVDTAVVNAPTARGESSTWSTSRTYNMTPPSSESGIKTYEYYVSNSSSTPSTNVTITGSTSSTNITSSSTGQYIFFRAVNRANTKSNWSTYYHHYVDSESPSLTRKQSSYTFYIGDSHAVEELYTVSYGISGGSVTCKKGSTIITNLNSLTAGNHTLSCTARSNAGVASSSISIQITIKTPYLVDAVKIGDFVNYNAGVWTSTVKKPTTHGQFGGYTSGTNKSTSVTCHSKDHPSYDGWRVISKTGSGSTGTVELVHAGSPECYYSGFANTLKSLPLLSARAAEQYINSTYASNARTITCNDASRFVSGACSTSLPYAKDDMIKTGGYYYLSTPEGRDYIWIVYENGAVGYGYGTYGYRPIVVLKARILKTGGSGAYNDPMNISL